MFLSLPFLFLTACDEGGKYTVVNGVVTDAVTHKPLAGYPVSIRITTNTFDMGSHDDFTTIPSNGDGTFQFAFDTKFMTNYGIEADTAKGYIGVWGLIVTEGKKNFKSIEAMPATRLTLTINNIQKKYNGSWYCYLFPNPKPPTKIGDKYYTEKANTIFTSYDFFQNKRVNVLRNFNYKAYLNLNKTASTPDTTIEYNITIPDADTCSFQFDF